MSWSTIDIAGKPAELFEPAEPRRAGLVFLHNAKCQSLSVSDTYTRLLEDHRLACICPFGGGTWWSDHIFPHYDSARSAERYVVDAVVPLVMEKWQLTSLGLLGISMGGQGALRTAFKRPEIFPAVAAIAPAIEYHEFYGQGSPIDGMYTSKEQCRQDTAPMHLNPTQPPPHIYFCVDPDDEHWIRGADRLHEKMAALGVAHECDLTTRAGAHSWTYFDAQASRAVEFLTRGLAHQARRLV